MDRIPASNVAVFNLGGSDLLDYLHNATYKSDVKHEEGKGVKDFFRDPQSVEGGWDIEGDLYASTLSAELMETVGEKVTVAWTVGHVSYTGNALMTTGTHTDPMSGLQMHKVTLLGKGGPTITAV